jgi:hypothetical protein
MDTKKEEKIVPFIVEDEEKAVNEIKSDLELFVRDLYYRVKESQRL